MSLLGKFFGTDGVRGVANKELTPDLAYKIARAGGHFLAEGLDENERLAINIGKDTRLSGDMLEAALIAGFNSVGIDVNKFGIVPTPGVAYLTDKMNVIGGVMISASHNPIADNGIKFFDKNGYKLSDKAENEIEKLILNDLENLENPTHENVGRVKIKENQIENYIKHVLSTVDGDFSNIKVVLDCANGAAYEVAPKILKKLKTNLKVINNNNDGSKINVQCGSTNPDEVAELVKKTGADLGIAHDGDADRVIFVDENGKIVDGDTIMAICALDMLERGKLKGKTLVTTRYSNLGLKELLESRGARVELAKNGDRYVLKRMREKGYNLGGEKSGHIIFLDYNKTGDGILTAVQLMNIIKRKDEKLSELSKIIKLWPQKLNSIKVNKKEDWKENKLIKEEIKKAETEIGKKGRVFVRASGTEPVIRLMLEGKNEDLLNKWENRLSKVIREELN
ncbi:MAG: phosphoglucosamine mutase [Bacillota bacterium]